MRCVGRYCNARLPHAAASEVFAFSATSGAHGSNPLHPTRLGGLLKGSQCGLRNRPGAISSHFCHSAPARGPRSRLGGRIQKAQGRTRRVAAAAGRAAAGPAQRAHPARHDRRTQPRSDEAAPTARRAPTNRTCSVARSSKHRRSGSSAPEGSREIPWSAGGRGRYVSRGTHSSRVDAAIEILRRQTAREFPPARTAPQHRWAGSHWAESRPLCPNPR